MSIGEIPVYNIMILPKLTRSYKSFIFITRQINTCKVLIDVMKFCEKQGFLAIIKEKIRVLSSYAIKKLPY